MSYSEEQQANNSSTNAYLLSQNPRFRKSQPNRAQQNKNHSLPSIGIINTFPVKQQKINVIRNQIDETKNQIIQLQARVNALNVERMKNQRKKSNHHKQIQFLTTVRGRVSNDRSHKQSFIQQREKEREELKRQADALREQLIRNKEMSKSILNYKKCEVAQEERNKRREDQQRLRRDKSIQIAENQLKAKNIRKEEFEIEQKNRLFYQSRVSFAKSNHRQKIERSLSEKMKMEKMLKKLKKKQKVLVEDCKQSQVDMLSSLYELESLNPERKRRGTISSRVSSTIFQNAE